MSVAGQEVEDSRQAAPLQRQVLPSRAKSFKYWAGN